MGDFIDKVGDVLERATTQAPAKDRFFAKLFNVDQDFNDLDASPPGSTIEGVTDFNSASEEFQLRQRGFVSVPLEGGGFTFQAIPDAQLDAFLGPDAANRLRSQRRISQLSLGRTEAAFEGNSPVSQGFERDAAKRREQIIAGLERGAGVTSTAGIQQLGREREASDITRERIRTGEITSGFGRQLSQEQFESQRIAQILGGFQQGRFGAAQLDFQQQDINNQLRLAQFQGQFQSTPDQQLLNTVVGGATPQTTKFLLQ